MQRQRDSREIRERERDLRERVRRDTNKEVILRGVLCSWKIVDMSLFGYMCVTVCMTVM